MGGMMTVINLECDWGIDELLRDCAKPDGTISFACPLIFRFPLECDQ